MKLVRQVLSPSPALAQRLLWWAVGLVGLPLALFSWWTILQAPARMDELARVQGVEVWHEPVGGMVFNQPNLTKLVHQAPNWAQAQWQTVTLPNFIELGTAVDLPPDAPKMRAWFRIPVPTPAAGTLPHGRQGLLGLRVQGGPWSVWADGRLIQANLSDWRIQWNVPLRVAIPLDAQEVFLAVPYAQPLGYAVGSIFIGPIDTVDTAWQERSFWHQTLPLLTAGVALLLMLVSVHLAWVRRQEHLFALLGANALVWSISCLQYVYDVTGQDTLTVWFASAVDSSITWGVVLTCIFAFELVGIRAPRLRSFMLVYAVGSTWLTLPVWDWRMNALMAQQYFNVAAYVVGLAVMGWHMWRRPRREGVVMWLAMCVQLALGVHTLENLSNQTNPDSFYSFPIGTVALYLAFMYAMGRRTVKALETAEHHEAELLTRLAEQEQRLATQHAQLQQLEVQRSLTHQRETILQDLHDRLGSNLTSALLQARTGALDPQETVLLLQDLTDELRHIGKSQPDDQRGINQVLAELRQRVQHRLAHGGIELLWDVDPALPGVSGQQTAQHLRALFSEAIANVVKHAGATQISLAAKLQSGAVVITLSDNGRGFTPENALLGRGLPGMHFRANEMGATLNLRSEPGQGSRLELALPVGT
jgi:signal transduction histidine kinase